MGNLKFPSRFLLSFLKLLITTGLLANLYVGIVSASDEAYKEIQKVANPLQNCQLETLKKLGFQVKAGDRLKELAENKVCDRDDVKDANDNGELVINYDKDNPAGLLANLPKYLESKSSICAYKMQVATGLSRASKGLYGNKDFTFGIGSPNFCDAPDTHWKASSSSCILAKTSPSEAIKCFYNDKCKAECAVGLQIANLAGICETFGDENMDCSFNKDEIVLGPWGGVAQSYNPFFGREKTHRPLDYVSDQSAGNMAKKGRMMLIGFNGYIGNMGGEDMLDSEADRGENYIITKVSEKAAANLASRSFSYYTKINQKAQKLLESYKPEEFKSNDGQFNQDMADKIFEDKKFVKKLDKLLADPVYDEITVFVHPLGEMTFGDHIRRLLKLNPRTAYKFMLYDSNINTSFFNRYVEANVNNCLKKKFAQKPLNLDERVLDMTSGELGIVNHFNGKEMVEMKYGDNANGFAYKEVKIKNLSRIVQKLDQVCNGVKVTFDASDVLLDKSSLENVSIVDMFDSGIVVVLNKSTAKSVAKDACDLGKEVESVNNFKAGVIVKDSAGQKAKVEIVFSNGIAKVSYLDNENKANGVVKLLPISQLTI
ncbi:MAG: hypothetical protein HQK49_07425 [Oligoflexia bacterium]|nr:hypothetical protein [Oligoflexia bacterium]